MEQNRFEISVNYVHKTIFGHRQGCTQARKHGGGNTGVQEHYTGYDSSEDVVLVADQIQTSSPAFMFEWCAFCSGDLKRSARQG